MKNNFYTRSLLLAFLLLLSGRTAFSQVTITADSVGCGATSDTLRAILIGDVPTSAGVTSDDGYSASIAIGFNYKFYSTYNTHLVIGSNGNLRFDVSYAGAYDPWPISAALHGNSSVYNSICGPWCDMYIPAGGTITYSTIGTAPYRKFAVTYCTDHMYSCTSQFTTSQVIIYETTNIAEVHIAHKTICASWNGGYAIVGVQNSSGSASTAAPGRDYPTDWTATNEAWRFTPNDTSISSYTCSRITYAPVPYSSSTITWYDSTTGAEIGTGSTIHFVPTTGDSVVYATAYGCADTSRTYFRLDLTALGGGNSPVHITTTSLTNPTICGVCNGTISLIGINPHQTDTVFYSYEGVPQSIIIDSADIDSTITITGLCAGTYDYFYVKQGPCPSNTVGPITLTDPAFTISGVTETNPTICGACDGTITLHGLVPGFSDTINYMLGGVPQTAVVFVVGSSGTVTLTGLPAGVYTGITATMNYCVSPPVTATLVNPSIRISDTSHTNASCSACDGTFTIYGLNRGISVTVNYNFNGTPQTPVTTTTTSSGSVTITGLCPGNYDNITATLNTCISGACVTAPVGTITIVPPPLIQVRITGSQHSTECGACNGSITITGMAPGTIDTIFYNMNGIAQTAIYAANPDSSITLYGLCAGDYSDFFIKVGPCPTNSISTHINLVDPPIVPGFTDVVNYGCNGDTVSFTNSSTSAGSLYYIWEFGDGYSDTATNPVHIYAQGTYHVTLLATNHHCVDSLSNSLSLVHPIQAIFTPSTSDACQATPITFTNSSIGTPPTYTWSFGDGTFSTVDNPTHTYNNVGTYIVKLVATNFVPCSDSTTTSIVVDSQSVVSLNITDTSLCAGNYITLNNTYTSIGNTGITWTFGNGDSLKNVNPVSYAYPAAGTYTVTATTTYRACLPVSISRPVNVFSEPMINLGNDTSICLGGETGIILSDRINAGNSLAHWLWSTGETTSSIGVTTAGCFSATVTINGCQATDSVCISNSCYLDLPDIFSPNGDGVNDYFYPRQSLSSGLTSFKMDIYNRWGQLIFETTAIDGRGWDGKFNDIPQPQGVFIYIIDATFKDGTSEHHKGNVTILR